MPKSASDSLRVPWRAGIGRAANGETAIVKRRVVISDIHGCWGELRELLGLIGPTTDDEIIALGDIVDRGPDSEEVLRFFRDTPNAVSIMGNHEHKNIRSARGETKPALAQLILRHQLGERYGEWLSFMETFARHIELPEAILVHGMLEPGVPLEQQKDTVVIGTLSGEKYLQETYSLPWYELYEGPKPVVAGHHCYLRNARPLIREGLVYAIDTSVAHGGRLTALILPEFRLVSVPSRGDHWTVQRRKYAVLAGCSRSDCDLDWEVLQVYADLAENQALSSEQCQRAVNCARIVKECVGIREAVVQSVMDDVDRIREDLQRADDWGECTPREQSARFARCVSDRPASHLWFAAWKGNLTDKSVRRQAKTPRELLALAEQLGIERNLNHEWDDGVAVTD
jgi:serine/threonine protein phosphatase 1